MAKKIKHLRGRYEEYQANNITPLEGEIALEEGTDGYTRMKVGDGKTPYLDLPYLSGTVVHITPDTEGKVALSLAHGYEFRCGGVTSLDLSLPDRMREDYTSSFVFDTGLVPPSLTYPKELVFCGDDCQGGLFLPQSRMRYTVKVNNRTDAIYGEVSGASLDLAYVSYYEIGKQRFERSGAFAVIDPDRILDVSLLGFLGEADTDGYMRGLGALDSDTQQFRIDLVWQNGVIVDYEDLIANIGLDGSYIQTKVDFREEESGFSYLANATTFMTLVNTAYQPLISGFSYRLRARLSLLESESTFAPNASLNSPFTAYYGIEIKKIPMKHIGNGVFEVDFTSDIQKTLTRINISGIGHSGRIFFEKDSVTLVAKKNDYEAVGPKKCVDATIYVNEPLHDAIYEYDTLSLLSQTVTRRIQTVVLDGFAKYDILGDYAVFKKTLSVPADMGSMVKMPYFTEQYSVDDVAMTPCSYYFDSFNGNGFLYFSGDETVQTISDMRNFILNQYEIIGFSYPKRTPTVEQVSLTTPLMPYEDYTFVMLKGASGGKFLVTQYTNEEKNEDDDDFFEDDY
ncbi:MAG: hypothetical protein IKC72_04420 [Clostridia bacterium]|nr:hypothetical protein [Clostridia bacterium]